MPNPPKWEETSEVVSQTPPTWDETEEVVKKKDLEGTQEPSGSASSTHGKSSTEQTGTGQVGLTKGGQRSPQETETQRRLKYGEPVKDIEAALKDAPKENPIAVEKPQKTTGDVGLPIKLPKEIQTAVDKSRKKEENANAWQAEIDRLDEEHIATLSPLEKAESLTNSMLKGALEIIPAAEEASVGIKNRIFGEDPMSMIEMARIQEGRKMLDELLPEESTYKKTIASKVANALGQAGSMAATGVGGAATIGATESFASEYKAAKDAGASEEEAFNVGLINAAGSSVLEALPVAKMLKRVNNSTGGAFYKNMAEVAKNSAKGGLEEAVTESMQQAFSNLTAAQTYDANREIMDGVMENGSVGGITGTLLSGMATILGVKLKNAQTPSERKLVEESIKELEETKTKVEVGQISEQSERQAPVGGGAEPSVPAPGEETPVVERPGDQIDQGAVEESIVPPTEPMPTKTATEEVLGVTEAIAPLEYKATVLNSNATELANKRLQEQQPQEEAVVASSVNEDPVTTEAQQATAEAPATEEPATQQPKTKESKFSIRQRLGEGIHDALKELSIQDPLYYEVMSKEDAMKGYEKEVAKDIDAAIDYILEPEKTESQLKKTFGTAGVVLRLLETEYSKASESDKPQIKETIDSIRKRVRELGTTSGQAISLMGEIGNALPLSTRMEVMMEATIDKKARDLSKNVDIEGDITKDLPNFKAKKISEIVDSDAKIVELERKIAALEEKIASKKTEKRKEAVKKVVTKLDDLIKSNVAYSDAIGIVAVAKEGIRLVKAAVIAGDKVADAIDKGVRYINAKSNGRKWDEAKFRADMDEAFADSKATLDELYDKKQSLKQSRKALKDASRRGLETGDFADLDELLTAKGMSVEEVESYVDGLKEKLENDTLLEVYKRIEKNTGTNKKAEPRVESLARKLAKEQPLTSEEKLFLAKKKYGIKDISLEDKGAILVLSDEIARVAQDPDLRMEAIDNLRHELQKHYPRNKFEQFQNWFDGNIWYPNMLSGLSTSALNIKDALFNTLSIGYLARKGGYQAFIDQFKGLEKGKDRALIGLRQGFLNSGTMYNLDSPDKYDVRIKNAEDFAKEGNKVAKYWSRWVGRAMALPNILNNANKYSALSFMIQEDLRKQGVPEKEIQSKKDEILFGTKEMKSGFEPRAVELVYGKTKRDPSNKLLEAKVRRTVENMVLEEINNRVLDADGRSALQVASEIAERATYQNKATGIGGVISKHIQKMLGSGPVGSIIKKLTGVDFVNTTFNVMNASLNHTPYGYFRANDKSVSRMVDQLMLKAGMPDLIKESVGYSEARSAEEKARILQKANTATALMTVVAIASIAGIMDDDEDLFTITGSGTPNEPLGGDSKFVHKKEAGNVMPPYTLRIGNETFSYLGTPFTISLSTIGNASDYLRMKKEEGLTAEEMAEAGLFGVIGSGKSLWDNTPMRHITDKQAMQKQFDTDSPMDWLGNFAATNSESAFGNLVPNLVKQLGKMMDPTVYTPKDFAGRIAKATAILNYAGAFGKDFEKGYMVDLLGNKVTNAPGERYFESMRREPSEDDLKHYELLWDTYKVPSEYPSLISPQTKVADPKTGKTVTLKDDPYLYSLVSEERGRIFKQLLDGSDFADMSLEERQEEIKSLLKDATEEALSNLGMYPEEDEE